MNKVFISGHISKIYDLKQGVSNGKSLITFNVKAYNDSAKKSFTVLECVAFGENALIINNTAQEKDYIEIEGKINNNNYKDKTGKTVYKTNVAVSNFEIIGKNVASNEVVENETVKEGYDINDFLGKVSEGVIDISEEDLPF